MEKLPWILYVGAAVLAYTAAHMIAGEQKISHLFDGSPMPEWLFIVIVIVAVVGAGLLKQWTRKTKLAKRQRERETH